MVGVLGAVSDMFDKHMEKLGTTIRIEVVQKTAHDKLTTGLRHDLRLSQRFKTCFKMLRHFP